MASYILFFKNANTNQVKNLMGEFGLDDLGIDGMSMAHVPEGPDYQAGSIAGWLKGDRNDPELNYTDRQKWIPLPENGKRKAGDVWVGINMHKPLIPQDLARPRQFAGNFVTLRDGNDWLVPAAQDLPHKLCAGTGGEVERVIEDRFQEYHKSAFAAMKTVFEPFGMWNDAKGLSEVEPNDQIETVTIADGVWLACMGLCINYRINREIALALELLDETCLAGIVACTFDMPAIAQVEHEKKKELVSIPATSLT